MISGFKSLIPVFMGDGDVLRAFVDVEWTGSSETFRSIMIAADYDHRYAFISKPLQAALEDVHGLDPGPDMVEDIAGMNYRIRLELDDLIYRLLEALVDHLFDQVAAVLVHPAKARKSQMRVRHVNYLHLFTPEQV
jgi:hypothetical protein